MNWRAIHFTPVDAWFFRDGRPYNLRESNQTDVESAFPPAAPTLVGALRAALARAHGWTSGCTWPGDLSAALGDGFDDLGPLRFRGPYLTWQSSDGEHSGRFQPLLPVPLHVLGKPSTEDATNDCQWLPRTLLTPDHEAVRCDLGAVRLPVPIDASSGLKEAIGLWITARGLGKVLAGEPPDDDDILAPGDLWEHESRVGMIRDESTRATDERALYSPRYVRLRRGVSVVIEASGLPHHWTIPELMPLGGEGRMASCYEKCRLNLPAAPEERIRRDRRAAITLLTPLYLAPDERDCLPHPLSGDPFPCLPGTRIVSACVGKPVTIGGWDGIRRRPLPLVPMLPVGSTWFCEIDAPTLDDVLATHGSHLGLKTDYGYGQIVFGVWPSKQGDAP